MKSVENEFVLFFFDIDFDFEFVFRLICIIFFWRVSRMISKMIRREKKK